jgi:hypothetical protein
MYEVIKNENEIKKCQKNFEEILQYDTDKPEKTRKVGTSKDYKECYVYYSSKLDFWSASYIHEAENGNRYGNAIGFKEPLKDKEYLFEDVNISFSETGQTSSRFVVEDENKIYFAHNGGVGIAKKNDKATFMEHYRKKNNDIIIDNIDDETLILIKLPSDKKDYPDFQKKFFDFTKDICEFRKNLTFPLEKAYQFLRKNKLNNKIKEIKELKSQNQALSSVRKGCFIVICEENKLLEKFIKDYFSYGKTQPGKERIEYYKKLYNEQQNKIDIPHYKNSEEIENNECNNKIEQQSKSKTMPAKQIKKTLSESSDEIVKRIKKVIPKINEFLEFRWKKKVFDESFELWEDIEKPCTSKNDFKIFSEALYNLFDKTRYKNHKYSRNNGESYYISMLPKGFTQDNPTTTHFIDIVNTPRHYYIHKNKEKITDVYEELLGRRSGPESSEDFQKLQIEVLKQFEDSMEKLLEMVKDDLNRHKTH